MIMMMIDIPDIDGCPCAHVMMPAPVWEHYDTVLVFPCRTSQSAHFDNLACKKRKEGKTECVCSLLGF